MNKTNGGTLSRRGKIVSLCLVLIIVGMVAAASYLYGQPPRGARYTDFFLLSPSGQAGGYATALAPGATGRVVLTVANFEQGTASYRVEVREFGRQAVTLAEIQLDDGAVWQGEAGFTPLATDSDRRVEFLLYKDGAPSVYRRLQLTVELG